MELFVIPLTLTLGVVLIIFGVHGLPSGLQLSRSGMQGLVHLPARSASPPAWSSRLALLRPKPAPAESDVLLADLMSEMIAMRAEMAELRQKFEAAAVEPRPAPARARRTAKAS